MLNFKKTDLGKKSYAFEITIPRETVKKQYDLAFADLAKNLEVSGFRKGKAPKNIAEKNLKKEAVYQKAAETIVSDSYTELIKDHGVKPVTSPKIELVKADEESDWTIRITVAEKPEVKLGDYKKIIADYKKEQKKEDIWVPGKSGEKKPDADGASVDEWLGKLIHHLAEKIEVDIADMIIDEGVKKRLSQLVDDVQKIGLTMDNYLASKGETVETLRTKYSTEIISNLKIDLILDEIADSEKITVEKADLDMFLTGVKDEKARAEAEKNAYYYAPMLKARKTLDFLKSL